MIAWILFDSPRGLTQAELSDDRYDGWRRSLSRPSFMELPIPHTHRHPCLQSLHTLKGEP